MGNWTLVIEGNGRQNGGEDHADTLAREFLEKLELARQYVVHASFTGDHRQEMCSRIARSTD